MLKFVGIQYRQPYRLQNQSSASDTPATVVRDGALGRPTSHSDAFTQAWAEREREGSAAESIQRMRAQQAARYRAKVARLSGTAGKQETIQREDRHRKISRYRASSFSLSQEQPRAKSCSIVSVRIAVFALRVWNETDIRFAPSPLLSRAQQRHNGS
jgi:hypothetical protein